MIFLLVSGAACMAAEQPPAPVTTITTQTTVPAPTPEEAVAAFDECAASAGAALPPLALDENGRPDIARLVLTIDPLDEATREALTKCSPLLADDGLLFLDGEWKSRVTAALLGFARCMREEGILAFPDPAPGFDGTGEPFDLDAVIRQAPGFDDAVGACSALLSGEAR